MPPVDLAVEEVPKLTAHWLRPGAARLAGAGTTKDARIVLFRRPIEHRAEVRPSWPR